MTRPADDLQRHMAADEAIAVMASGPEALIQRPGQQNPSPAGAEDADIVDAARVFAVALLNELPDVQRAIIAWAIDRGRTRVWVSVRPSETVVLLENRTGEVQCVSDRLRSMDESLELWQWRYIDEFGKQRVTRYLLTENDARARLKDPQRIEGSLEVRKLSEWTLSYLPSSPASDQASTTNDLGNASGSSTSPDESTKK